MKKSVLFSAVFFLCVVCTFAAESEGYIKDHPVITAGCDAGEPFCFINRGVPSGYFVDYLNKIASKAGLMVSYAGLDENKPSDVVLSVHEGFDKPSGAVIPALVTPVVMIVRDTDFGTKSINKLNGRDVAVVRGSFADDLLSGWPEITKVYVKDTTEGLKAVVLNRAYAVFAPDAEAAWLIKRNSLMGLMSRGPVTVNGKTAKDWLSVTVTDGSSLLYPMLKDAAASVSDQEKGAIISKWILKVNQPSKRPADLNVKSGFWFRHIFIVAAIVAALAAAVFVIRRRA